MKPQIVRIHMLVSIACLTVWLVPALPVPAGEPLAGVEADAYGVTFQPEIAYDQVRVTVTGPEGFEATVAFDAGETPVIELPGADGLYKYELRFSPVFDPETLERMASARETGAGLAGDKATASRTVQSGWFRVEDGSVVPELVEIDEKVVLTNGDGVIRNSLCVGFDCPDNPGFDDSTILLMENNTRIKFGDTSNAPFPNNDWEIEANSSLSGGLNYLGFNDCGTADNDGGCANDLVFAVESGARPSALYVEDDGDVGIGTSLPILDLHVVTGNTPALRLDQDGSSGFSPQVWDIGANETNFFVRDVTGGSRLPLRIRPGAPTSSIDISGSGDVGIGTSAPAVDLHIQTSAIFTTFRLAASGASPNTAADMTFTDAGADGAFRINIVDGDGRELEVQADGDLVVAGTCLQIGANRCTVVGTSLSCSAGSC